MNVRTHSRRLSCLLFALLLMVTVFLAALPVSADHAPVRVIGYHMEPYGDGNFYLSFFLDTEIGNARHLQTQTKKPEADLPEDSWDFDALLTDAGRNNVIVNGISIGEFMDATGGIFNPSLHFEKAERYNYRQTFTMNICSYEGIGNGSFKTKDFTVEVLDGMITREHWKFEPFVAKWDAKTQKLNIYREGDGGLTLEQVEKGEKPTTPTGGNTTAGTTGAGTTAATTGATTTGDTTGTGTETQPTTAAPTNPVGNISGDTVIPALGQFDVVSKDEALVTVNFGEKTIKLAQSMTVSELMAQIDTVSAYKVGVYNGSVPVGEGEPVYTGYRFKVYVDGDKLIGNFALEAPAPENNMGLLIALIIVAVVVVALVVVLILVLLRKKGRERKETT